MNKVLYISAGILLLVFTFTALGIALTASMASLANGAANLASSTALLTGQCLIDGMEFLRRCTAAVGWVENEGSRV